MQPEPRISARSRLSVFSTRSLKPPVYCRQMPQRHAMRSSGASMVPEAATCGSVARWLCY